VEYRILGTLEVVDDGHELRLGSPKERELLAVLLLHAGEVVSRDRLIDALWGQTPPPTAHKALNVHVSQLRKTLTRGGANAIATHPPGYVLRVEPERLDAARFEQLVADARGRSAEGDVVSAAPLLRDALALWRGPVLDGVELEAATRNEARHLEELRLAAQMDRIDCDLALGLHEQVIAELEALIAEHPLRERLRGQLMLALYRSGRQADALRCYREARDTLVSELGIEPSVPLQRLERAILNQDPSLEAPTGIAHARPQPARAKPRLTRRRAVFGAAAVVVAAAVAAALVAFGRSSGGARSAGRVVARIPVPYPGGPYVGRLAFSAGSLWIRKAGADQVLRVDPATNKVVARIKVGFTYDTGIAVHGNDIWVTNSEEATVSRIDATNNRVVATIRVGDYPLGIVATDDAVWVANHRGNSISRIDPRSNRVVKTISTAPINASYGPMGLAYAHGELWAEQPIDNTHVQIWRLDPRRNTRIAAVAELPVCGVPATLSVAGDVWHANCARPTVTRIDARTAIIRDTIHVGCFPSGLFADSHSIWIAAGCGQLLRVDPRTDHVVGHLRLTDAIWGTAGAGSVWVVNRKTRSVVRIQPTDP
jgi:YVTN family beta-propeller protein